MFLLSKKLQSNWKGPNSGNIEFGHIIRGHQIHQNIPGEIFYQYVKDVMEQW